MTFLKMLKKATAFLLTLLMTVSGFFGNGVVMAAASEMPVAIGDVKYATLEEAIEAAQDGETIEVLKDTEMTASVTISGKSITIDLCGFTIETVEDAMTLATGGKLTVENGAINHSDNWEPIYVNDDTSAVVLDGVDITSSMYSVYSYGSVTVNNCNLTSTGDGVIFYAPDDPATCVLEITDSTLTSTNASTYVLQIAGKAILDNVVIESEAGAINGYEYTDLTIRGANTRIEADECITINGSKQHVVGITIEDGTFIATGEDCAAIYHPTEGALTISGGYFEGDAAIYAKCGVITISGGEFVSNGVKADAEYVKSGYSTTGDAIIIEASNYTQSNPGITRFNPSVTITGGAFKSANADPVAYYVLKTGAAEDHDGKMLSGGIYSAEPNADLIADGYKAIPNNDPDTKDAYPWMIGEATYVAQIGEVKYETLAAAVAAVEAGTETTIVMIANETIPGNAGVTIPAGKQVILDLNGFTVKNSVNENKGSQVILNKGTLTIKDSSAEQTGLLINAVEEGTAPGEWWGTPQYNYATNTITNNGTLTIEGGRVEQTAASSICYAIDNNSSAADATITVKGGEIIGVSNAIRMFANSTTKKNDVVVEGGLIKAGYSGIWVQLPGSSTQKKLATLTVTGGTLSGRYAFYDTTSGDLYDEVQYTLSGGVFDGMVFSYGANIEISGGTYKDDVAIKQAKASNISVTGGFFDTEVYNYGANASAPFVTGGYFTNSTFEDDGVIYKCVEDEEWYVAEGYIIAPNKEPETKDAYPWKIRPVHYVAQIGDVKYESLAEAIEAVPADGTETTIVMIANETIPGNAGVTIPAGKQVVLDLNGFTVKNAVNENKGSQVILNKGTLTIKDSSAEQTGLLINAVEEGTAPGEWWGTPQYNYATNTILNNGALTIEGGRVEQTAAGSICYAIDNNSSAADATITVKGGEVIGVSNAIRMFANSTTKKNDVVVEDGLIQAGYAGIWVQLPGSSAQKKLATLTVSGGTLKGGNYAFYDYSYGDLYDEVQYTLSGGEFDGEIFSYGANVDISGGTYRGEVAIKQVNASNLTVTGGFFDAEVYNYGANASDPFVTGGYFTENTFVYDGVTYKYVEDQEWYVAEGYTIVPNEDPATKDAYPWTIGIAKVTILTTSKAEGIDNSVSPVTGGGAYQVGETVTLTATPALGYVFKGWANMNADGTTYTMIDGAIDETYTFTASIDETVVAVFEIDETVGFKLVVVGSRFKVKDGNATLNTTQKSRYNSKVNPNRSVTIQFTGREQFLFWVNEAGKVVSTDETYTFYMIANSEYTAIYSEPDEEDLSALFVFRSIYDQLIETRTYVSENGALTEKLVLPTIQQYIGRTALGWFMMVDGVEVEVNEDTVAAAIEGQTATRFEVYPKYTYGEEKVEVTIKYTLEDLTTELETAANGEVAMGATKAFAAPTIDGYNLKGWYDAAGNMLGQGETFVQRCTESATYYAVYTAEEVEAVPTVTMSDYYKIARDDVPGAYNVSFTALHNVPAGYTLQETGFVFSTSAFFASTEEFEAVTIANAPEKHAQIHKIAETNATDVCTLAVPVAPKNAALKIYVRAFLTYTDAEGLLTTIYSDDIYVGGIQID